MEEGGEEVVFYPVEFSGYRHIIESPYLELSYAFRERLTRDFHNIWIIIGSSLRDRTICSIMNDVVRLKTERERPKIIFVNPDKEPIERLHYWGYQHLRTAIRHIRDRFGSEETNTAILNMMTERITEYRRE